MSLSNASPIEWFWVGLGLLWGSMTLWGSIQAWLDLIYIYQHTDRDPQTQLDLQDRARTDLYYEMSSLLGAITLTYFGFRSLLLPPNPISPELWWRVGAYLAVAYILVKTSVSVRNRFIRYRFDDRIEDRVKERRS